jgi:putative addiction module component (TIGR02574 family)
VIECRPFQAGIAGYNQHKLRSTLSAMERSLKEVFREAAQLPERDRATLTGLLIETLDPVSEPDVEAAWSEEIRRRVAEIDAGTVELIPWEEVRAELFGQSNES